MERQPSMSEPREFKVFCPTCRAAQHQPCRNRSGRTCAIHPARKRQYAQWHAVAHPDVSSRAVGRAAAALARNKARIERA
jgi:hypothetical protein